MFGRHRARQAAPRLRQSTLRFRQRAVAEALETRRLLSTTDFGQFSGRLTLDDRVSGHEDARHTFTLSRPAVLTARATPTLSFTLPRDIVLSATRVAADGHFTFVGFSDNPGTASESFRASLGPGTYFVSVEIHEQILLGDPGTSFIQDLTADFAGETLGAARDMGVLLGTQTANDFIGTAAPADLDDFYKFSIIANGNLNATLSEASGNTNDAELVLIQDRNNNGVIDPLEAFATSTASGIGTESISRNLNTGTYFARVTSARPGTNYSLSLSATPSDNAGNTVTSSKDVGVLTSTAKSFNDFVGAIDTTDVYKFAASGGGPFVFNALLTGLADGSDAKLELLGPSGNFISASNLADNADERIDVSFDAPGTYFVRVSRIAGDTAYSLSMSNTNTDVAGNTLATALNHGPLNGHFLISDVLSQTDVADVIQFSLAAPATISASFPLLAGGEDATLELLSSAGAILQTSVHAGTAAESIVRATPAGTYFVRVSRFNGIPRYTLTISADAAGNTVANARPIRLGFDTIDYLDTADPVDLYKFTTVGPTRVSTFLSLLSNNVNLTLLRDINKDGGLDPRTEVIASTSNRGTFPDQLNVNLLTADTYFLSATSAGGATDYGITFASSPIDNAGNTLAAARDVGLLGATPLAFDDFVGAGSIPIVDDADDFYRFTIGNAGPYIFTGQITNLTDDADLELIRDDNLNNRIDPGESLVMRSNDGIASDQINLPLTVPGRYFLHVLRSSGNATYHLTMNATSTDTAPDSLLNAKNIGLLDSTLAQSEFVGAIDPVDVYKFGVTSPGTLYGWLSGLTGDADIEIIRNTNGNNTIDAGEVIAAGHTLGTGSELLNNINLPAAGTYFARVLSAGGDANYNLMLMFTAAAPQTPFGGTAIDIPANAQTTIQAENFDDGGEGVAYHDTDAVNQGGKFRSNVGVDISDTADAGGGFRISTIHAGEFLEYSVNVPAAAVFDVDFRVANTAAGAKFHLEVDNIDKTGPLTVPNTGGIDVMTTLTKTGLGLTAGPHVIKLAFDVEVNGSAGSINFLKFRPFVPPVQTVTLAPVADSFVRSGIHATENHGGEAQMAVKKASADTNRESYLKFDISSFTTASSAKLRLFGILSDATDPSVQTSVFSALNNSWTETGINDTNKPVASASALATTTITGTTPRLYEWDITAFLQAEKAAGHQFITLVLKNPNTSTSACVFNTREAGTNRPQMVVTT